MVDDSRESGSPRNGTVDIASGNSSTQDVLDIDDDESMSLETVIIDYESAGTTEAVVEVYDEPAGTSSGNLGDRRIKVQISPDERVVIDNVPFTDIEDDIVALADGNQDSQITVTAGGFILTR